MGRRRSVGSVRAVGRAPGGLRDGTDPPTPSRWLWSRRPRLESRADHHGSDITSVPGRTHGRHHRRLRRRAPGAPWRDRAGAAPRRRPWMSLGGRHLRQAPGNRGPTVVGSAAADGTGGEDRTARGHRCRRVGDRPVRRGAGGGVTRVVRPAGPGRLPRDDRHRRGRGLPFRPQPRRQRRPAPQDRSRAPTSTSNRSTCSNAATGSTSP